MRVWDQAQQRTDHEHHAGGDQRRFLAGFFITSSWAARLPVAAGRCFLKNAGCRMGSWWTGEQAIHNSQWSLCCAWRLAAFPPLSSAWSPLCVRTALRFACAVVHVFAPPSPTSPAPSPLAARGYGPAYLRASPSKLRGPSRPSASLITGRVPALRTPFGRVPQFGMVVPHLRTVPPLAARCSVSAHCASLRVLDTPALRAFGRSQARLRLSLVPTIRNSRLAALPLAILLCSLDFRFACFRHWRRRSSVPIGLTPRCFAHRARASCAPRASSRSAAFDCALRFAPCARHSSPSGLRRSQSSLEMLPASLGSSAAIAATGCAASFALIGLTTACFAHCARPSCAPLAAPPLSPSLDFRFACFAHCARRSSVPRGAHFVRPRRTRRRGRLKREWD